MTDTPDFASVNMTMKDMEKDLILKTLERMGNNRTLTAQTLGISLRSLQYKLKSYAEDLLD